MLQQKIKILLVIVAIINKGFAAPQKMTERPRDVLRDLLEKMGVTIEQLQEAVKNTPFILNEGITRFNSNLMRELVEDQNNDQKNIVISPFSIHTALSMTFYGSPEGSQTHQEIATALGLDVSQGESYLLNYLKILKYYDEVRGKYDADVKLANKIFVANDFSVKKDYQTILRGFYLSSADTFDVKQPAEAESQVNEYVNEKTEGLIHELLAPGTIDDTTRMIIVNAIYYRANWQYKFNEDLSGHMEYNLLGGKEKIFHLHGMRLESKDLRLADYPEIDSQVLELPYENKNFNMYVIVPNQNSLDSLNKAAKSFNFFEVIDNFRSFDEGLYVEMPGFDTSFETNLVRPMKNLGVIDLFDNADLGDMTNEPVLVSDIVHEAAVKVDEKGSKAAAATGVIVNTRSGGRKKDPKPFIVDRPFVFVIIDNLHNIPLFVGKIVNPAGQDNPGATTPLDIPKTSNIPQEFEEKSDDVPPTALHMESSPLANQTPESQAAESSLPDCGELGYQEVTDAEDISFPCKGKDTLPIQIHKQNGNN